MMPSMPPAMITHVFDDIATATRIESTAKTMSVSSTLTTVAQNADSPKAGFAGLRCCAVPSRRRPAEEVLEGEIEQIGGADQLHPAERDQLDREQRREDAERERADDAVAQRLLLLCARQAEDQDGQHQRVVGAEQALEQHEQRRSSGNPKREHPSPTSSAWSLAVAVEEPLSPSVA